MTEPAVTQKQLLELWEKGRGALAGGWVQEAEKFYAAAFETERRAGLPGRTSAVHLGRVYVKQGRVDEAMHAFEVAVPLPAAFTSMISLFRVEGKAAMKAGDTKNALLWFNRMLSVSNILAELDRMKKGASGWDGYVAQAMAWLNEIKEKHQTIYAWTYAHTGAVPNDPNLSSRDYKTLHQLSFGV